MTKPKLIITCGGTGGHFFPGLSVARVHAAEGGEVLLLLSGVNAADQRRKAEAFGIRVIELPPMPSPGGNPLKMIRFAVGLIRGLIKAGRHIRKFRADAVLGMGSFASLPVILAAKFRGVPIYLHDGNARIGRANRVLSRFARFLGTAFPAVNAAALSKQCRYGCIGMPLRPELLSATRYTRTEALAEIKRRTGAELAGDRKTILIFGGSQGAATLNRNFPAAFRKMLTESLQVIHLAGPRKAVEVEAAYAGAPFPTLVLPSCDAMEMLYGAADLVISRSGGSTVAELTLFGKPALLVPYPYAAEGHQWDNADFMVDAGAALAIDDADCTTERIVQLLTTFLDAPEEWKKRGEQAAKLARPRAAHDLLAEIAAGVNR